DPFNTAQALSANVVCTQTKSGSNTWYAVCASDSMTSYSDASTITCTRATNSSHSCIGGCAYGTECRSVSSTDPTAGECVEVLSDDVLHSCVSALFPSGSVHIDSLVSPVLLSVASLKTLVSVDDGTGTISPSLSCSGDTISDLAGIEHLTEITHIDLSCSSGSDGFSLLPLTHLTNMISLNIDSCDSLAESLPFLYGIYDTLQDLSLNNIQLSNESQNVLGNFTSLASLKLNSCGLNEIPNLSSSRYSLSYLDIGNCSIDNLLPIFEYSLMRIEVLFANDNMIYDPTPLYLLCDSLVNLDISNNYICDIDSAEFISHFSILSQDNLNVDSQYECSCSTIPKLVDNKICRELWPESSSIVCAAYSYRELDSSNEDGFSCISLASPTYPSFNFGLPNETARCLACSDNNTLNMECLNMLSYDPSYLGEYDPECDCSLGWYGEDCNEGCPVISGVENMCGIDYGYGTCNSESRSCICSLGWGGDNCSENHCDVTDESVTCSSHGDCVQLAATASYCVCDQGFGGSSCSETVCNIDSNGFFCSGVGECIKNTSGEFHCASCALGFIQNDDKTDCISS
ncbi:hypothetical protein ADUPG1_011405, partial [Aduncisulcus paluster]